MGVVGGYVNAAGSPATKLLNGLVFAVGLNFVFMAGAELFTGNNFTMSAASIKGEVSWGKTIKVWIVCYLGNLLGSVVTAGIFMMTGLIDVYKRQGLEHLKMCKAKVFMEDSGVLYS